MKFLSAGEWVGSHRTGSAAVLLVAPGHSAGLRVSAHGPLAAILNYSAGYRDSAHGPQSRGVSTGISHQGVSSE